MTSNEENNVMTYDMLVPKENNVMSQDMLVPDEYDNRTVVKQSAFGIINTVNMLLVIMVVVLALISIVKNIKGKNIVRIIISIIALVISLFTMTIMGNLYLQMRLYGNDVIIQGILVLVVQMALILTMSIMILAKRK